MCFHVIIKLPVCPPLIKLLIPVIFFLIMKGSMVHGLIKKRHVAKFQSHIEEDGIYIISNFMVIR